MVKLILILNNRTVFPDDFKITDTMRNLDKLHGKMITPNL
jgi:hypothetical protein